LAVLGLFLSGKWFILRVEETSFRLEDPLLFNFKIKSVKPDTRLRVNGRRSSPVHGLYTAGRRIYRWEGGVYTMVGIPGVYHGG